MKLSIVIPIYNEVKTLQEILKKVEAVKLHKITKEIVMVDDFSTDGTRDLLKKLAKKKKYKIVFHKKNGGKGRALRTGLKHTTGDIIIIQDADLEYDPEDYKRLIVPILKKRTQVVYGSRFKKQKFSSKQKWAVPSHYLGNKFLSLITSVLYFRNVSDMETCYKMFTRKALKKIQPLRAQRFDFEPELTAKFIKNRFKIIELPIKYYPRDFDEGKKIDWRDGVKAVMYLLKYRFFN